MKALELLTGVFRRWVSAGPEVASHIILNIYDDDHYRNLDSLRSIRSVPPSFFSKIRLMKESFGQPTAYS